MELIKRKAINKEYLPGRMIQKAVGQDALSKSAKMTMGLPDRWRRTTTPKKLSM